MMDVSTLNARTLADFERYLEASEYEWIDYTQAPHLDFAAWRERENPCDPDVDE